jgi:predicted transcriptional regulator
MSEMISMQRKPTFRDMRKQAKTRDGQPITRQEIATRAGLTSGEMYAIEMGGYSSPQNIQAVLRVFNELTGQRLTMNDIRHGGLVE